MAARKRRAKQKRRNTKTINLLNVAESIMIANLATSQLFGANLRDFLFAGTAFSDKSRSGWQTSGDPHTKIITLNELFRGEQYASSTGTPVGFGTAIAENARANAMPLIAGAVLIPVGFKLVKKFTRKPRTATNRILKMAGLNEVKV